MQPKVYSFHYVLKDSKGAVLESSHGHEPFTFLEGAGSIIPGLENAVKVLKQGDKKTINVSADQAYGIYDEQLIVKVPKAQLPKEDVSVGDQFHAEGDNGMMRVVVVKEVHPQHVMIDGNHPLSGQDLCFDVEVIEVRDATSDEVQHGHAHGPGGHHH